MAKKKDKPQVINNIGELNLEIDYDKLAESIVKAQEKSENEANRKKKFTSGTFATLITFAFYAFSTFGWIISVAIPISIYNMWSAFKWDTFANGFGSVATIIFMLGLMAVLVLYSILLWKSAKEIETEKDRNYIISVFSGIVSFAALIVALVALFKGVG